MTHITMPRLSDSMQEGTILSWLKPDGARVDAGDELVEIETEKATVTYTAPEEGTLVIVAQVGTTLPVGSVIAHLTEGSAAVPQQSAAQPRPTSEVLPVAPDASASTTTSPASGARPVRATPLARRMATAHKVELTGLAGSGPGGRIVRSDVERAAGLSDKPLPVLSSPPPAAHTRANGHSALASDTADRAELRGQPAIVEPTRIQHVIARRMTEAKATVPEFQVQTEVSMDAALDLRKRLKDIRGADAPSLNDLVVKASALALRVHPRANAAYQDGRFALYPRINVGVAVAAPDALMVPVVLDADKRSLADISRETRRLSGRVRTGAITPSELSGATFTVSNLGMYGMTAISPIIDPPQVGILGVGATRTVPAIEEGELVAHERMTLTLTCDHRILYGADAAEFLSGIRELLEQPLSLVL